MRELVPLFEKEGKGEIFRMADEKNPPQSPFFKGGCKSLVLIRLVKPILDNMD